MIWHTVPQENGTWIHLSPSSAPLYKEGCSFCMDLRTKLAEAAKLPLGADTGQAPFPEVYRLDWIQTASLKCVEQNTVPWVYRHVLLRISRTSLPQSNPETTSLPGSSLDTAVLLFVSASGPHTCCSCIRDGSSRSCGAVSHTSPETLLTHQPLGEASVENHF